MGKKLYVGNLAYSVRDSDLEAALRSPRLRTVRPGDHGPRHRPLQRVRLRGNGQRPGRAGGHQRPQRQRARGPQPNGQRGAPEGRGWRTWRQGRRWRLRGWRRTWGRLRRRRRTPVLDKRRGTGGSRPCAPFFASWSLRARGRAVRPAGLSLHEPYQRHRDQDGADDSKAREPVEVGPRLPGVDIGIDQTLPDGGSEERQQ